MVTIKYYTLIYKSNNNVKEKKEEGVKEKPNAHAIGFSKALGGDPSTWCSRVLVRFQLNPLWISRVDHAT